MKKKILLSIIFIMCFIFGISNVKAAPTASDVAEIDGSYYKSISAAINATSDNTNTTIKLLKDRKENFTVSNKKDIVLDLNGFTLRNNGTNATVITNNGKLEIKNGTVTSDATSGMINNNSEAVLVLNGGNYIATGTRQALYNKNGTATIKGNAYLEADTSVRATVHNLNNGKIIIESGTIVANNSYAIYNDKGTLNIGSNNDVYDQTSPVIQGKTYGVIANDSINIYDGIIKGETYHLGTTNSANEPTIADDIGETKVNGIEEYSEKVLDTEIIGGETYHTFTYYLDTSSIIKITFDPQGGTVEPTTKKIIIGNQIGTLPKPSLKDNRFDGWFTTSTGGTQISESTTPSSDVTYYANWTYVDPNTVAYVEGVGLMSLEDAFAIGGNIRLEKDVIIDESLEMNKAATLDLNGHTITLENKFIRITEEVTIKDTSENETGKITSDADFTVIVGKSDETTNGHLTFESGTIEGLGAYGSIRNYETLDIDGGTATSTATVNGFTVYNDKTLNMNSGTIYSTNGRAIQVYENATLTMNGGLVKTDAENDQSLNLYGDCSAVINGGTVEGTGYNSSAVSMFRNTNLVVNGGDLTGYALTIAGNGSESNGNANITINGGNIVGTNGVAMYLPQRDSTTIINGGNISGTTGIEIRAGELIVNDGVITGTSPIYEVTTNDNGDSTKGVAIGVSQHVSKQPLNVVINDGVFSSVVGLCIVNPLNNPPEATALVSVYINGGDFTSTGAETILRDNTYPNDLFISGGIYTTDPTIFVEEGYVAVKTPTNRYRIDKAYKIIMDSTSSSIVSTDKKYYLPNETVELNITPKRGYELVLEVKDALGDPIEVKDNKFTMPGMDVIVYARYEGVLNPLTGDKLFSYILLLEISIIGLLSIKVYYTKRKDI